MDTAQWSHVRFQELERLKPKAKRQRSTAALRVAVVDRFRGDRGGELTIAGVVSSVAEVYEGENLLITVEGRALHQDQVDADCVVCSADEEGEGQGQTMGLCAQQLVAQVQQVPDQGVVQDGDVEEAAQARKHPAHTAGNGAVMSVGDIDNLLVTQGKNYGRWRRVSGRGSRQSEIGSA